MDMDKLQELYGWLAGATIVDGVKQEAILRLVDNALAKNAGTPRNLQRLTVDDFTIHILRVPPGFTFPFEQFMLHVQSKKSGRSDLLDASMITLAGGMSFASDLQRISS